MESLTRREEQIMLVIGHLKENAYLVSIGAIHIPLRRLERSGVIDSYSGAATAVRGGRRKKIYRLTQQGLAALKENKKVNDILWANFPEKIVKRIT